MRLGFATDIHLDVLAKRSGVSLIPQFGQAIASGLDALVISGDISTGPRLERDFGAFVQDVEIPVYFVLGNHDFWKAREQYVRETAAKFPGYLDTAGVVELTPTTALIGRSGWYDTLTGNPFESRIRFDDFHLTERLAGTWGVVHLLQRECRAWAAEETERVRPVLEEAVRKYPNVIFATHFPCFKEACWDEFGFPDIEDRGFWPWSINTTLGHLLLETVTANPGVQFTMLTGHTHGGGSKQLRDNLLCISGNAEYGYPQPALSLIVT